MDADIHKEASHKFNSIVFKSNFISKYGTLLGIVCIAIIFSSLTRSFMTFSNIMNIFLQSMPLIMVSLAMTTALVLRGVDLTVAYVSDLASLAAVSLLISNHGAFISILGALGVGAAIGAFNGILIINGVPALVATLGMMFIIKSMELLTTGGGQPLLLFTLPIVKTKGFLFLGQGKIGLIPTQVIIGFIVVLVVYLIFYQNKIGRYFQAIGGNVKAAFFSGIRTKYYFALGFIMSGILSAMAGVMNATRTGVAQPEGSSYLLLDAFVASYIGSITFRKGRMNILGSVVGAFFVSVLSNGVTVLGLGIVYQYIFKGVLIFMAVMIARTGLATE